ncbi:MAG: hypothetical protein ACE5O2_04165 [Armatimonadota bacterium]
MNTLRAPHRAKEDFVLTGLLRTRVELWVLSSHPLQPLHVAQRADPTTQERL